MNRQSRSQSKRRGLTLSLSRQKRSQPREHPNFNITQPISSRKAPNVTFSHSTTQRIPSPSHAMIKVIPQQPKIIYRMKRSEWDQLQSSNREKRNVVYQIKNEAHHLGEQINQIQQRTQNKIPISSYRHKNTFQNQQCFANPLPVYPVEKNISQPLQIIPQSPQKQEPHTTKFTININCKTMGNQENSPILTEKKQTTKSNIQKTTLRQQILNTPYQELCTNRKEQNVEPFYQYRRKSIDLGALSEIQNRLNDLIRFTES